MKKFFLLFLGLVFVWESVTLANDDPTAIPECNEENEIHLNEEVHSSLKKIATYQSITGFSMDMILSRPLAKFPSLPVLRLFSHADDVKIGDALKSSINMLSSPWYRHVYLGFLEKIKDASTSSLRHAKISALIKENQDNINQLVAICESEKAKKLKSTKQNINAMKQDVKAMKQTVKEMKKTVQEVHSLVIARKAQDAGGGRRCNRRNSSGNPGRFSPGAKFRTASRCWHKRR